MALWQREAGSTVNYGPHKAVWSAGKHRISAALWDSALFDDDDVLATVLLRPSPNGDPATAPCLFGKKMPKKARPKATQGRHELGRPQEEEGAAPGIASGPRRAFESLAFGAKRPYTYYKA